MPANYYFKTASLDPKLLAEAGAELHETPHTIQFKTPSGHTVLTPFSDDVVAYQQKRLGGPEAYYKQLGEKLRESALANEAAVERERDAAVSGARVGRAMIGGTLGAVGGRVLGGLLKRPALGTALGTVGGATIGGLLPVQRASGPETRYVEELPELYQEPEANKQLRAMRDELEDVNAELRMARYHRQSYPYSRYDPYDPYDPYGGYRRYGY